MKGQNEYENYVIYKGWSNFFQRNKSLDHFYSNLTFRHKLSGKSLLEIGFGNGTLLRWAKDRGAEVSGIELQTDLCKLAAKNGVKIHKNIESIKNESLDFIFLIDVLEHMNIQEIYSFFSASEKKVRINGSIFIRFPNCQSLAGIATHLADITHKTMLSEPILRMILQNTNLEIISVLGSEEIEFTSDSFLMRKLKNVIRFFSLKLVRSAFRFGNLNLSANIIFVFNMVR